jgi:hypothetical protein
VEAWETWKPRNHPEAQAPVQAWKAREHRRRGKLILKLEHESIRINVVSFDNIANSDIAGRMPTAWNADARIGEFDKCTIRVLVDVDNRRKPKLIVQLIVIGELYLPINISERHD